MIDSIYLKSCCAGIYGTDLVRLVFGGSLHPGGSALTERLGRLVGIGSGSRVLDLAAGRGLTAVHLARSFGCEVVGVEYSAAATQAAYRAARLAALGDRVRFACGDAEALPCAEAAFDTVVCECAFCTFPDKAAASTEVARVLRPGGAFGLADLVLRGPLPPELDSVKGWIACIAGARPSGELEQLLRATGLSVAAVENHDGALVELVRLIRVRVMGLALAGGLAPVDQTAPEASTISSLKELARAAERAVLDGRLGYELMIARKPRQEVTSGRTGQVDHAEALARDARRLPLGKQPECRPP